MSVVRSCPECTYRKDQHDPDCPRRRVLARNVQLTAAGNRRAFEQSLERIMRHTEGTLR